MKGSNIHGARVIEVIEVTSTTGEGTKNDPVRTIVEYYSKSGELLAREELWQADSIEVYQEDEYDPTPSGDSQEDFIKGGKQ